MSPQDRAKDVQATRERVRILVEETKRLLPAQPLPLPPFPWFTFIQGLVECAAIAVVLILAHWVFR